MRRVLSVWCPNWATERLAARNGSGPADPGAGGPVVTVEAVRGVRMVAAACPRAQAAGVEAGQKLADARAVCPSLAVHDADPAGDVSALERLAAWCERYTPLAAANGPDGLWLDVTGCAHLWDGEGALLDDLVARLARAGHRSRAAVADTPGAAWALARVHGAPIVAAGTEVLMDLPTAVLRLPVRTVADLRRAGLRTVRELLRLGRGELAARFGPGPVLRLDQMLGRIAEHIAWPRPPMPWEERVAFAEPVLTPEDLHRVLGLLAERLCGKLGAVEKGARRFAAEFFRVDGVRPVLAVATARPVRDPAYLHKLLAAKLDTVDPGFGVDVVRLFAEGLARLAFAQPGLEGGEEGGRLPAVLDQVLNRSDPGRVWRTAPYESHVPERATVRVSPTATPDWCGEMLERPLRLMARPEPIEAVAMVPDHPPVRFTWRGVPHRVRGATGPERIAREWWRGEPADADARPETDRVRDYYCLEDMDGARFWVFRAGLLPGRWFLHGVFG